MKRRNFLTASALATASVPLAAPSIVRAQDTFRWQMTNAYGPGSPFYVEGPGSPTDFCAKVERMSGGRLVIQHFAAGELIPALEGFDAVAAGTVQMNAANSYFWAGRVPAAQYFTTVPFGAQFPGAECLALPRRRHGTLGRAL
jgi:TRAP-type mannitol/chloroaromatic compound transport system substrate-binding protein